LTFEELRLAEPIARAIGVAGYTHPTPIQAQAIPHALAGRDVLGFAQTGTGKTAAFALPILHRLTTIARQGSATYTAKGARALVVSPTRELAQQVYESFCQYARFTPLRCAALFGGVPQHGQERLLRTGVDVLVATPGRLLDLMDQGCARMSLVEVAVLDEADRMLDIGFLPDIRRILVRVPEDRQMLLFSATMSAGIGKLVGEFLRNPVRVEAARVSSAPESVEHWVHFVEQKAKPGLLAKLLRVGPRGRTLVFTRTKRAADHVARDLQRAGVRAAAMHGDKEQDHRLRVLEEFRTARTSVLVATDVASRGLHVDEIARVINYDVSAEPETYVHRVGRTGRAGASGVAVTFCTPADHAELRAIEALIRAPLKRAGGEAEPAAVRAEPGIAGRAQRGRNERRNRRSPARGQRVAQRTPAPEFALQS